MKLLILTQKIDLNDGVLGFFHGWIEEFAKNCEAVTAVCLYQGKHNLPANVKVLSLGKESGASRLKYLYNFYKYIRQERKNYDAVFVHMNQIYVILGAPLWRLWRKKIGLWYAHGKVSFSLRAAEKFTDLIFTSTKEGCRLDSKKIRIVGQGIDVNKFRSRDTRMETQRHADGNAETRGKQEFLYPELTYKIRGACFEVWKRFRGAFKEKIIERALVKEITSQGLKVEIQKQISVIYKNEKIGAYVPDLIVENKVLIELKSKPFLTKEDDRQFWLYLQGSEYKLGLLINFGNKLEIKRRIYDKARNNIPAFPRESAAINNQRSSAFKIITIGRISPAKDYETLIRAAEILKKENLRFRIEIIGGVGAPEQEKYLSELKKMIVESGLEDVLIFVGGIPHEEIINYLAAADLFVNMSRTGSLDKAILEAMAAGLSVVTSNEAAVKMLSAFAEQMVFPQKDFQALAERIKFFIKLPDLEREKYGGSLRKIVETEHGLKGLIEKIIKSYV